jgi:phage terminase small subunit
MEYLLSVMNDPEADKGRRDRAAAVLAPFMHARAGETGKKEARKDAAGLVSAGKFGQATAPKLVVNNT